MNYNHIPWSIPCPKGCSYGAGELVIPAVAILGRQLHWFLNRKAPYMIRTCVKCETNWIVVV